MSKQHADDETPDSPHRSRPVFQASEQPLYDVAATAFTERSAFGTAAQVMARAKWARGEASTGMPIRDLVGAAREQALRAEAGGGALVEGGRGVAGYLPAIARVDRTGRAAAVAGGILVAAAGIGLACWRAAAEQRTADALEALRQAHEQPNGDEPAGNDAA